MAGSGSTPSTGRDERTPRAREYAGPSPTDLQAEVDADEKTVEASYQRWQEFTTLVAEAVRRADAMVRLERALEVGTGR